MTNIFRYSRAHAAPSSVLGWIRSPLPPPLVLPTSLTPSTNSTPATVPLLMRNGLGAALTQTTLATAGRVRVPLSGETTRNPHLRARRTKRWSRMFRIGGRRRDAHLHRNMREGSENTALVCPIEGGPSTPPEGGPGPARGLGRGDRDKRERRNSSAGERVVRTSPGLLYMNDIQEEGEEGSEHTSSDRDDDDDDDDSEDSDEFSVDLGLMDDVTCDEGFDLGEVSLRSVALRCVYSVRRRLEETCRRRGR